jgi:hypothetical protein
MIVRNQQVTTLNNNVLQDSNLSWKARGLLAFFLSFPDNKKIRINNMRMFSKHDGCTSVASGIRELKSAGYMTFQRLRNPITKSWQPGEWVVSETPSKRTSL